MQIIGREVELEVMRRATPIQGSQNPAKPKQPAPQAKPQAKPKNHLQKLTTINLRAKTKDLVGVACIFFSLHN